MARDMSSLRETIDHQYPEMRWRILSLAADFDRIERAANGGAMDDPRLADLRRAIEIVLNQSTNRAEQVQMLLSDHSPPPPRQPAG